MDKIYTNAKGIKLNSYKMAAGYAKILNETAENGLWTWDLDKDNSLFLYFRKSTRAKAGA